MPTPTKGKRLGSGPAHQRLLLANLATALFEHGRITTTEAKAKRLRPLAERLVTFAKRGDLHARRQALTVVRDKSVVHTLFSEIGPRYETRNGGYTRITKIGPRKGDNAPMAVIELVEGSAPAEEAAAPTGGGTRRRGARRQPAAAGAEREASAATSDASPEESGHEEAAEAGQEAAQRSQAEAAAEEGEAPAENAASGQTAGAEQRSQAEGEAADESGEQGTGR